MNRFAAIIVGALTSGLIAGTASVACAQDASSIPGTQTQTQTPAPSPSDTSSPLTPTNPNTATPLTPTPPNPVAGQNQQQSSAITTQSSSEVPTTFVQPQIETNRVDPAAPSNLQLVIDPASAEAALLNPDATQLSPTTAGLSLNAVQGTTPSPIGSAAPSVSIAPTYPALISEPTSTQTFLTELQQSAQAAAARRIGSSRTSMGPLIGSAAVQNSVATENMSSAPTPMGASTFMRAPMAAMTIASPIGSASQSIGPSALRTSMARGSSSMFHRVMSSFHH